MWPITGQWQVPVVQGEDKLMDKPICIRCLNAYKCDTFTEFYDLVHKFWGTHSILRRPCPHIGTMLATNCTHFEDRESKERT